MKCRARGVISIAGTRPWGEERHETRRPAKTEMGEKAKIKIGIGAGRRKGAPAIDWGHRGIGIRGAGHLGSPGSPGSPDEPSPHDPSIPAYVLLSFLGLLSSERGLEILAIRNPGKR